MCTWKRWTLIKIIGVLLMGIALSMSALCAYKYVSMPATDRAYFSWWNKSNPTMLAIAKKSAGQNGFEYIETTYRDYGDYYRVVMDYRIHDQLGSTEEQLLGEIDKRSHQFKQYDIVRYDY